MDIKFDDESDDDNPKSQQPYLAPLNGPIYPLSARNRIVLIRFDFCAHAQKVQKRVDSQQGKSGYRGI